MTLEDDGGIAGIVREASNGYEVTDTLEVKRGTRGLSARVKLSTPKGDSVRAFLKLNCDDSDCFRREADSARLVQSIPEGTLAIPKLLFVSEPFRLIAWEELGGVRSLGDVLQSENSSEAVAALSALTTSLARLHLSTTEYRLPHDSALRKRAIYEAQALRGGSSQIVALFVSLGESPPASLDAVIDGVAEHHESDGPLVALTHGDQAPSNVLFDGNRSWLVDFEFGGFRPMLYDLATWSVLCPLPATTLSSMLSQYKSKLTQMIPSARTSEFERSWGSTCTFRALSMAMWFGSALAESNGDWGNGWDRRSALTIALERATAATQTESDLTMAHQLLNKLSQVAHRTWAVEPPSWPALN